ncbi:unnamed protein product, partial [Tetraodon nigroviridis]
FEISTSIWTLVQASVLWPGSAEASVDRLCDLCDRLHGALDEADLLGRSCAGRSGILGTLFRLIDLDSARLQLRIAELCLAVSFLCKWACVCVCVWVCLLMSPSLGRVGSRGPKRGFSFAFSLQLEVSGNNLLNICKLIFQISRSESNDIFFQKNSII